MVNDEHNQPEDQTPRQEQDMSDELAPQEPTEGWTPEQPKTQQTTELPPVRKPNNGESLDDPVGLLRESYSTIISVMERQAATLDRLAEREDRLMKELRERGRRPTPEDGSEWFRQLAQALETAQTNLHGESALAREDSEWVQVIDHEGTKIRTGSRRQRVGASGASPEEILSYISKKSGVGTTNDIALYHSGLWLRIKSPTLADLTGLQFKILQSKVELGNATKGHAYSNLSQTVTSLAVDFALQFVIDANVHYQTPSDLKSNISVMDYPILLWGLAYTLYPQGFPYAHPCVADPAACQHIERDIINVNRLFRVDHNSLSRTQKKHMAQGLTKQSTESLTRYREEHVRGEPRKVWIGDFGLELKIPNMQEYEDAGREWIENIIQLTQGAFNEPPHGANRKSFITSLAYSTTARQYSHWVCGVYENDEEEGERLLSDDQEVIDAVLDSVFSTDEYIEDFLKAVRQYMDDSLIAMIAINSFNCPNCKSPVAKKFYERFEHLVPIDVLSTFFTLVDRKLS